MECATQAQQQRVCLMMAMSFAAFMLVFLVIGLWSARFSRGTRQDYYLASRAVSPGLAGLSAVATNNSGYMFIGLMGFTYATGLASVWLMVGWIAGDFIASLFIHRRLRDAAAVTGADSFAGVLSQWHGLPMPLLRRAIALVSLIFLTAYAGAQLLAAGKALQVLLHWPLWEGVLLGALLVCVYCFSGGIRASIWTDAAQSFVMIAAMAVMLAAALVATGGPAESLQRMSAIAGFLDWFPRDLALPGAGGAALFIIGWLFAGFSVIGQPHVMVRFMAIDDPGHLNRARIWYYAWFILFYGMATAVGMLSRIYLSTDGTFDAELTLPLMAMGLLPPILVGLVLAGIFAATISTADSLILSCSAALTADFFGERVQRMIWLKGATILFTFIALLLALSAGQNVFSLVVMAWSALASAFGPLLFVCAMGGRPGQSLALSMMVGGLSTAIGWRVIGWHELIYEGLPGMCCGVFIYVTARAIGVGQLDTDSSGLSEPA